MDNNNGKLYINEYLYTDVHSWEVLETDGTTAKVVRVERDFIPKLVPGGFSAVCLNDAEQHFAPLKRVGEPFEIECRKGAWGHEADDVIMVWDEATFKKEALPELLKKNANWRLANGKITVYAGFRKNGKPRRKFYKLGNGRMVNHCDAFYDNNF